MKYYATKEGVFAVTPEGVGQFFGLSLKKMSCYYIINWNVFGKRKRISEAQFHAVVNLFKRDGL